MRRLLCSVALVLGAASASAQELGDVLATVDGREITLGELLIARSELPPQFQQMPDDVLFEGLLEQLIQQQLIADSVTEEPERLTLAIRTQIRTLKAGERLMVLTNEAVSEEAVQARFLADYPPTESKPEYHARHILIGSEEEAFELLDQIRAGADFAETAKEHSTGPSGPNGGDLGWFGQGVMVPAFEEAITAMEPGAVSDPVETQFGWHLIKLEEVRVQAAPLLEEKRAEIEDTLRSEAVENYLTELQSAAEITRTPDVDPSVIGKLDLLGLE